MSNGLLAKSFLQISEEMLKSLSIGGSVGCGCGSSHDHFGNKDSKARDSMFSFLRKLGLKSPPLSGWTLGVESLNAALSTVTYDSSHLKLWSSLGTQSKKEET